MIGSSIDGVTGTILKDGKAAVSTMGQLFGTIEKIAIAVTGLFLICQKFPSVGKAIKTAVSGIAQEASKVSPVIARMVSFTTKQFGKLASTDLGRRVGLALLAPFITKALLLMAGGAVIAAGAFAKFFLSQARGATDIKDLAAAMDTTTTAIQGIKAAAEVVRAPLEDVQAAIQHIEKTQSEAITGSQEMRDAYQRLGLTLDQVKKMTPNEMWENLATAVKDGRISVGNFSQLLAVMGKDSKKLIPAMKSDIVGLAKEYEKWGSNRNVLDLLADSDLALQKMLQDVKGIAGWFTRGLAAGANLLTKRADSWLTLAKAAALAANPATSGAGVAMWEQYGQERAQIELANDDDYAQSKEKTTQLESKLAAKASIRAAERAELETLREKNDEKEREVRLSEMSAAEREKALRAERDSLQAQMDSTKNEIDRERIRHNLLGVEQNLARVKQDKGFQGEDRRHDDMTRIGLYRGTSAASAMRLMQQQITLQERSLQVMTSQRQQLSEQIRELATIRANLEVD